jgi:hypothetical protein
MNIGSMIDGKTVRNRLGARGGTVMDVSDGMAAT